MKTETRVSKTQNPTNPNDSESKSSSFSRSNSSIFEDDTFTRSTSSRSCSFLFQASDGIGETIKLQTVRYTSLKDLLPASPPPPPPTAEHNSSWVEVPIRNPLVKQAALAYLQPMGSPPELDQGPFGKFKEVCCGGAQCGCIEWVNGVVFGPRIEDGDGEEDDDHVRNDC